MRTLVEIVTDFDNKNYIIFPEKAVRVKAPATGLDQFIQYRVQLLGIFPFMCFTCDVSRLPSVLSFPVLSFCITCL